MSFPSFQAPVFYSSEIYSKLNAYFEQFPPSKLFILTDSNTQHFCLPSLLPNLKTTVPIEILEMEPGEEHKNIETCTGLWEALSELNADRNSLMINLGGGVVTDLGGFVACTFKRGIPFINIPTTLLSMVDASVGGKTGVDLGSLKNQVGVIREPEMVLINTIFLESLPANEMRSGLAEILKHGLIADEKYWYKAVHLEDLTLNDLEELIRESVRIKSKIVQEDPTEKGLRKTLNFGHTFGHAIESYFLENPNKNRLLHGEAVAAGMIIATYISCQMCDFSEAKLKEITESLLNIFPKIDLEEKDFSEITDLLKFDKKNSHGNINFVLLKHIGEPVKDVIVPPEILNDALHFYLKC